MRVPVPPSHSRTRDRRRSRKVGFMIDNRRRSGQQARCGRGTLWAGDYNAISAGLLRLIEGLVRPQHQSMAVLPGPELGDPGAEGKGNLLAFQNQGGLGYRLLEALDHALRAGS